MMTPPEKSENVEVLWPLSQAPVGEEAHGLVLCLEKTVSVPSS